MDLYALKKRLCNMRSSFKRANIQLDFNSNLEILALKMVELPTVGTMKLEHHAEKNPMFHNILCSQRFHY